MHTFLTPEPVTLEIRNAAGDVRVVLTDTATTTIEVVPATSHPMGFLDDMLKSFGGGRGLGRVRQFGRGGALSEFAQRPEQSSTAEDLADSVRVEHRPRDGDASKSDTVEIDSHPARDGWRSSFAITVTAPTGSNIRLKSQSSDFFETGTAGLVDIRTASGRVVMEQALGKAVVQTASGDVTIAGVGGDADIRTASGNIRVGPIGGDVVTHSTSGDIELGAVTGNISARSVSGNVQVSDAAAGQADLSAVSGDVRIGVHPGSLASVDLTTVSGTTDTDFEVTPDAPEGDSPVLRITIKTTSGDIRLHRVA